MFDLEKAITEWRRQITKGGVERPDLLDELESHLREDIRRLGRSGLAEAEAFRTAVEQLGDGAVLRNEFAMAAQVEGPARARAIAFTVLGCWFILMGRNELRRFWFAGILVGDFTNWGAFIVVGICLLRLRVQRPRDGAPLGKEFANFSRAEGFGRFRAIGLSLIGWWFILMALNTLAGVLRILLVDDPRLWSGWGLWSKTGTWNVVRLWTELAFSNSPIYVPAAAMALI